MIKYICSCGYIYNSAYGDISADIDIGVKFIDLPMDWQCPFCGSDKTSFYKQEKKKSAKFISFR